MCSMEGIFQGGHCPRGYCPGEFCPGGIGSGGGGGVIDCLGILSCYPFGRIPESVHRIKIENGSEGLICSTARGKPRFSYIILGCGE